MALIRCPECGREVSDKNGKCIHCGCPINLSEDINNYRATAQYNNNHKTYNEFSYSQEGFKEHDDNEQQITFSGYYCGKCYNPLSVNDSNNRICPYCSKPLKQLYKSPNAWTYIKYIFLCGMLSFVTWPFTLISGIIYLKRFRDIPWKKENPWRTVWGVVIIYSAILGIAWLLRFFVS